MSVRRTMPTTASGAVGAAIDALVVTVTMDMLVDRTVSTSAPIA